MNNQIKNLSKRKIIKKASRKSQQLKEIIQLLKKQQKPLWLKIAGYLSRPKKKEIIVNIDRINSLTKANDIIIIPGKVLGNGTLNHKLSISAYKFSKTANKKLKGKADLLTIKELLEKKSQFPNITVKIII